jgi:hypothetical protein
MIQFLQPIWLWAMTAIAVPLFIHLWNIRQGKTLKVGSIAFLTESTRAHSRSLRISELLLLLLRCLLLIILALLLSNPVWIKSSGTSEEKGWVLIAPQHFSKTYAHFKPKIDSLQTAGFTLRRFDRLFTTISSSDTSTPEQAGISYWQLIQELNQRVPASMPVYIFTDNNAEHFKGVRPPVSLALHWQTYTVPDSASHVAYAFSTPGDSIRAIIAHSGPTGNRYSYRNEIPVKKTDQYVDSTTYRIAIFTDSHTADASYIKAAANAIRDFTQRRIQVVTVTDATHIPADTEWLFWLSEKSLPAGQQANNVLVYAGGKAEKTNTTFTTTENNALFHVYTIIPGTNDLNAVWSTGNGNILLGKDPAKNIYRFYSRFNPQWTDLVWSEQFPEIIHTLIGNPAIDAPPAPSIDEKQVLPETVEENNLLPKAFLQQRSDLSGIFWILAFILFLAERSFTYYSKRTVA